MKSQVAISCLLLIVFAMAVAGQNSPLKPVVFAVLNNGSTLEPIGYIVDQQVEDAIDGASEAETLTLFHQRYFKPKTSYHLVFGGGDAGLVTVKSSDPSGECVRHTAQSTVTSTRTALKGNVMALAVSASLKPSAGALRRAPWPAERAEVDALVRAELGKNKVPPAIAKKPRSQNLTAIDINGDEIVEIVGSYWVQPTPKSRSLIFFIAESDGVKYTLGFSDFGTIKEEDTMSNDITSVDGGVGHELLLDVLDIDGDRTAEIFTYEPSFEGAGFNVYRRERGKWTRIYETANYRCGF